MSINLTIVGQIISFGIFVMFCMKFVWPPIIAALNEREKKIAEGLQAASKADRELELAKQKSEEIISEAKGQSAKLIEQANKRANQLIDEAKENAVVEGKRIMEQAQAEVDQQVERAKESLRADIAKLAVLGAEKILDEKVDQSAHQSMLDGLVQELK